MTSEIHRIEAVETVIVDLPLVRQQRFAALLADRQSLVLIFLRTDSGVEGVGESSLPSGPWWGGESVESIKANIDNYLAPLITGGEVFRLDHLIQSLDRAVHGNTFAKAGIEMALLDIQGKILNQPVYNLLGGKVRDALPVSWPLATGDAEREIEEAEAKLEARLHNVFKLKMGAMEPEKDVARACKVIRALQGRASVRADPNNCWDETTAAWAVPRMVEAGLEMIEQPLQRWNLAGCTRLTAALSIPHMLDESVCTLQDMLHIAASRAASLISLKLMKTGGMRKSKTLAELSLAAGIPVFMGTFLESSYGTGANMQFCATLAELPYGGELAGALLASETITEEPPVYRDFQLQLQEGIGLGVNIDRDKLRAFRRDRDYSMHPLGA